MLKRAHTLTLIHMQQNLPANLQKSDKDISGLIERGEMVPDALVIDLLLEALLINGCDTVECGVLVDGFPRTSMQVGDLACTQLMECSGLVDQADPTVFFHSAVC